jgi:DNA-binding transcriptional ArsR family regulator
MESSVGTVFEALADPTRRKVVELLGGGPLRAGELAKASRTTPATMSKHLRVLLDTGLVAAERRPEDARIRVFRLRPQSVLPLQVWLDRLKAQWDAELDAFKAHVEAKELS